MATVELDNVCVDFPIYNVSSRSLKKSFMRLATGGSVSRDSKERVIVRSLSNISLKFTNGDRVGLVGHNGAGKSTFLRLLANIYEPTSGVLKVDGHISPMLSLMHGIEGEFTGHENIIHRGLILGLTRQEINRQVDFISEMTGLGDYIAMPVRTYSSGMMVRLAFAISTCINPEILLIDEVFGAGDAAFMKKARSKMVELLDQASIVVLASHSDNLIKEFCNKAILLDNGKIKYLGDVSEALELYSASR